MGAAVIGNLDSQVEKIFLDKFRNNEREKELSPEEREKQKREEEELILL